MEDGKHISPTISPLASDANAERETPNSDALPSPILHPPSSSPLSPPMLRAAAAAIAAPPFRGGAVENLGGAPMLKGHGNAGQPFDLETACYLKPIFAEYDRAIANGQRLLLVIFAAVKTLKSYLGEACAADHICNRSGDAAIFFASTEAANTTSTTRILDHFKGNEQGGGIPRFQEKMKTVTSRFDDAMGAVKFPDKTFFILSANLGNCAQKNLAFVMVQDCYVLGRNGMIDEAEARTTQYKHESVIILESQGGDKGDDFDRYWQLTDQRELHVVCPGCGRPHIFNWKVYDEQAMTRGDDFEAVLPREQVREILARHGCADKIEEVMEQMLKAKG